MKPALRITVKSLLIAFSVIALLLAMSWGFFAFTYQWRVSWYTLIIAIPIVCAIASIILFIAVFLKRKRWRWGFYSIGTAIFILIYTGVTLNNLSYIVFHESKNNPLTTVNSDENTILTLVIKNMALEQKRSKYIVVAPENTALSNDAMILGMFKSDKDHLINQFIKQYAPDENLIHVLDKLYDRFIQLNEKPWRLTIQSSIKDGYYIDYGKNFDNYFQGAVPVYYHDPVRSGYIGLFGYHWFRPDLDAFDMFGFGKWRVFGRDFSS